MLAVHKNILKTTVYINIPYIWHVISSIVALLSIRYITERTKVKPEYIESDINSIITNSN
jgi:hypothetical protein